MPWFNSLKKRSAVSFQPVNKRRRCRTVHVMRGTSFSIASKAGHTWRGGQAVAAGGCGTHGRRSGVGGAAIPTGCRTGLPCQTIEVGELDLAATGVDASNLGLAFFVGRAFGDLGAIGKHDDVALTGEW